VLTGSQIEPKASDLVAETGEIVAGTGEIVAETGEIVAETGDIVAETCNLRRELIDGLQDLVALADGRNVLELHDLGSNGWGGRRVLSAMARTSVGFETDGCEQ